MTITFVAVLNFRRECRMEISKRNIFPVNSIISSPCPTGLILGNFGGLYSYVVVLNCNNLEDVMSIHNIQTVYFQSPAQFVVDHPIDNLGQRVGSQGANKPLGRSAGQCCARRRRWPRMVRAVAGTARVGHPGPGRREPDRGLVGRLGDFPGIVLWCCLSFTCIFWILLFLGCGLCCFFYGVLVQPFCLKNKRMLIVLPPLPGFQCFGRSLLILVVHLLLCFLFYRES